MPITVLSAAADGDGSNATTTPAIDTTGATCIVLAATGYNTTPTAAMISDSAGNSWTALTSYSGNLSVGRFFYCLNPTTSSSHTFTISAGFAYPPLAVIALAGTAIASATAGESGGADTTPGPLTPSQDNCIVLAFSTHIASGITVNDGFTEAADVAYKGSGYPAGICLAYKIQTTAASANPTFSATFTVSALVAIKAAATNKPYYAYAQQ